MIIIRKLAKLIIFLIISSSVSNAQYADQSDNSAIDWKKGYITATGISRVAFENGVPVDRVTGNRISLNKAREASNYAAREMAILNLSKAIKRLRVDHDSIMLDVLNSDERTQKLISEKLSNDVYLKYFPSDFDTTVCEAKFTFGSIIESIPYDFPENDFPARAYIPISTPYTSLVVECRGMKIKPMLFPSIYANDGLEIYGRYFISGAYAVKGGMVSYCYDDDQAYKDDRAGEKPYFAAAVKSINNCPVLTENDVRRILSNKSTVSCLKKCRVIFIIDKGQATGI